MITCEVLDPPANGEIIFTNGMLFESLAIFECDTGFSLIGTDRIECQENDEWSGQPPECIGMQLAW